MAVKQPRRPPNWEKNIHLAKQYFKHRHLNQMVIAALALEVCEISWGGSKYRNLYNLKKFSEDSGIDSRTLSNWVGIRISVYDKLPPEIAEVAKFTNMAHTAVKVLRDAPPETVLDVYRELTELRPFDAKMRRYLADIRSVAYNFEQNGAARKCSDEVLEEFLHYTRQIWRHIKTEKPGLKARSHGISSTMNTSRTQSAAAALDIPRKHKGEKIHGRFNFKDFSVKVTPKDRDIINFLRANPGKFHSPTDIGVKLKGHNRNSASAWAVRTINKFRDTGLIERNKMGHYKWVG